MIFIHSIVTFTINFLHVNDKSLYFNKNSKKDYRRILLQQLLHKEFHLKPSSIQLQLHLPSIYKNIFSIITAGTRHTDHFVFL